MNSNGSPVLVMVANHLSHGHALLSHPLILEKIIVQMTLV